MAFKKIISQFALKLYKPARLVFDAEKPSGSVESAEAPKLPGIPIDTEGRNAAALKEKESYSEWEKRIKEKYGGSFFKLNDIGAESPKESQVYIDAPDMEKFKGQDPKVVMYFHGDGGFDLSNPENAKIFKEIERRRKAGEPIVAIGVPNQDKKWSEFDNPRSFEKIIDHAEKLTGKKLGSISLVSHSGGYQGIGKILNGLETLKKSGDPKGKKLYESIKNIGFMDSLADTEEYVDSVADWAAHDTTNSLSMYWEGPTYKAGKEMLQKKLEQKFAALNKKMENIHIPEEPYKNGHTNLDSGFFREFLDRTPELLKEDGDYGLKFRERSPESLNREQLIKALDECENPEQRDELILSQVLAGNVPDGFKKPTIWETEINDPKNPGKTMKVKVPLYGMLKLGPPGDEIIINASGQGTQAIAEALGAYIPPGEFYEQLYNDPKIQKAPFWYGADIEGLANKYTPGLSYHTKDGKVSGAALQSMAYTAATSERYYEWCKLNGIDPNSFTLGHGKTIFMPLQQGQNKLTFGGGLHDTPIRTADGGQNWKVSNQPVQVNTGGNLNYNAHEQTWWSMAVTNEFIGKPVIEINGVEKTVSLEEILTNEDYAHLRPIFFGGRKLKNIPKYDIPPHLSNILKKNGGEDMERTYKGVERVQSNIEISPSSGGIPISAGEGRGSGGYGGGFSGGGSFGGGGSYMPSSFSSGPEQTLETREVPQKSKVFAIGDSLSHGFVPGLKDMDVTHVHPQSQLDKKYPSSGQTTETMKETLRYMLNNYDCEGSTLMIVGGSNDLFARNEKDPLSIKKITDNLTELYKMARGAGMKVVTSTLPPVAYSPDYSGRHGDNYAKKHKNLESADQYNDELIKKWQALNKWIVEQEGTSGGPDKVIQVHKEFEDPKTPGKLRADLYGNGDGVHLANYSEMSKKIQDGLKEVLPKESEASDDGYEQLNSNQAAQNAKWRRDFKGNPANHRIVGPKAMEILKDPNVKLGDKVEFEKDGVTYVALKEWHPGNGPHKKTHKGVSVAIKPGQQKEPGQDEA